MLWWRHQMETFAALLALCGGNSPVTGGFPSPRPVTRNFDAFFDLRLNKQLNKQSWGWWFETPSCPLWRHCNVNRFSPFLSGTSRLDQHDPHFADVISLKCISCQTIVFYIQFHWCFLFLKGPIENNSASVWVKAWSQAGNKPLSKPTVTNSIVPFMRNEASNVKLGEKPYLYHHLLPECICS